MFAAMKEAVKTIDPTRPTTGGINGGYTKEGYISVEGILGMNYHNKRADCSGKGQALEDDSRSATACC